MVRMNHPEVDRRLSEHRIRRISDHLDTIGRVLDRGRRIRRDWCLNMSAVYQDRRITRCGWIIRGRTQTTRR